jgi:hypothetical protein
MNRLLSALLLGILVVTLPATAKGKKHDWQQGKLLSIDESRYLWGTTGSADTEGKASDSGDYSGATRTDSAALYTIYQIYTIESDSYIYVVRERQRKPAPLTVNGPIRYAIEKDRVFILDENSKVHEAMLRKKTLKEKK